MGLVEDIEKIYSKEEKSPLEKQFTPESLKAASDAVIENLPATQRKKQEQMKNNLLHNDTPKYTDLPVRNQSIINVGGVVYEPLRITEDDILKFESACQILIAPISCNNDELLIVANKKIESCEQPLVLQRLSWEKFEHDYLKGAEFKPKNFKKLGLTADDMFERSGKESRTRTYKEIFDEKKILFELMQPIENECMYHFVLHFGLEKILQDYLMENAKSVDKRILLAFRHLLLFPNTVMTDLQKFSGHQMLVTGTKTGKSTLAAKIAPTTKYDGGTAARLLGYSTSDQTFIGDLDKQNKPVILDDFSNISFKEDMMDALPSAMEQGISRIGKGKQTTMVKTCSAFTLTTNLNKSVSDEDLFVEFHKAVMQISKMQQRMGSRFGLILFGKDFAPVVENGEQSLSKKELNINRILTESILEKLRELFEKIFDDEKIIKWLNTQIESYKEQLDSLLIGSYLSPEVLDFWNSHKEGYRHIRGISLRLAFLEYCEEHSAEIFSDKCDFNVDSLIEKADEELTYVCSLNMESLRKLVTIQGNLQAFYNMQFDAIKQKYIKVVLLALADFGAHEGKHILLDELGENIQKAADKIAENHYSTPSQIKQKISFKRFNQVAGMFGVDCFEQSGNILLRVLNPKTFENVIILWKKMQEAGG